MIRWEREEAAERSLKYYRNCDGSAASKESLSEFQKQYDEMRQAIQQQMKDEGKEKLTMADFCKLHKLSLIRSLAYLYLFLIIFGLAR